MCFNTNNQIFKKDCFVIRQSIKIFYREIPDEMAASTKFSTQCYDSNSLNEAILQESVTEDND